MTDGQMDTDEHSHTHTHFSSSWGLVSGPGAFHLTPTVKNVAAGRKMKKSLHKMQRVPVQAQRPHFIWWSVSEHTLCRRPPRCDRLQTRFCLNPPGGGVAQIQRSFFLSSSLNLPNYQLPRPPLEPPHPPVCPGDGVVCVWLCLCLWTKWTKLLINGITGEWSVTNCGPSCGMWSDVCPQQRHWHLSWVSWEVRGQTSQREPEENHMVDTWRDRVSRRLFCSSGPGSKLWCVSNPFLC